VLNSRHRFYGPHWKLSRHVSKSVAQDEMANCCTSFEISRRMRESEVFTEDMRWDWQFISRTTLFHGPYMKTWRSFPRIWAMPLKSPLVLDQPPFVSMDWYIPLIWSRHGIRLLRVERLQRLLESRDETRIGKASDRFCGMWWRKVGRRDFMPDSSLGCYVRFRVRWSRWAWLSTWSRMFNRRSRKHSTRHRDITVGSWDWGFISRVSSGLQICLLCIRLLYDIRRYERWDT